ncbi:hypothetical protein DL93DRAFT_999319 [Clavulina sp. PMI_390]|nr:hypothetical protein DL93DRAFT_999319 [Clavulina sp. PMI_390]
MLIERLDRLQNAGLSKLDVKVTLERRRKANKQKKMANPLDDKYCDVVVRLGRIVPEPPAFACLRVVRSE